MACKDERLAAGLKLQAPPRQGIYDTNLICFVSADAFTDGGKDIALGQYGPIWKLHRKIASKALRYMQLVSDKRI